MRGEKTGLVVVGVGDGGVGAWGRCIWASWWARSVSRVCSRSDDTFTSWSEASLGSECSASEAESRICSWAPCHEYRGLFSGYKMMEDYNGDSLVKVTLTFCYAWLW